MLGLGEKEPEIFQTMNDLREGGCQVLTMGQYLRPTPNHLPVVEFVTPEQFDLYGEIARKKGFEHVASGPLVRSSYHAADFPPVVRCGWRRRDPRQSFPLITQRSISATSAGEP